MSGPADLAGPLEQRERDDSLARQAAANAEHETPFTIEGVRVCLDCYEPIPPERIKANEYAVRCTDCQDDHDRRRARGLA